MARCAVQAVWTMSNVGSEAQAGDAAFLETIVPSIEALPGFVQGVWAFSADRTRTHHTVVFEDREGAEALIAQFESNKPYSSAVGVHLKSAEIMDVVGMSGSD